MVVSERCRESRSPRILLSCRENSWPIRYDQTVPFHFNEAIQWIKSECCYCIRMMCPEQVHWNRYRANRDAFIFIRFYSCVEEKKKKWMRFIAGCRLTMGASMPTKVNGACMWLQNNGISHMEFMMFPCELWHTVRI